jgi:diaminohydroxyphosphoribosylaminopyrimidine deaminase/5-amino-6-(5-phosphoribosylamino)uracil reductase
VNNMFEQIDECHMQRALALGERARISAPPNPWVGCVLVKDNVVVGEGFTEPDGGRHAEVVALSNSGDRAQGATAYVTLEPCAHFGRTPPCIEALIRASISRVVVAITDTDPRVAGKGIENLRQAGIPVTVGTCAEDATASLVSYLHHRKTQMPYSTLKMALSIDGRSAATDGSSQWISSEEARHNLQRLRAESQAILIGSGTAISDDPLLTVREGLERPIKPPLRVIVDSYGKLSHKNRVFNISDAPTLIATTKSCPQENIKQWQDMGVEVFVFPTEINSERVDLKSLFVHLAQRGVLQVLTEGGSKLHASLLKEGLCNRLVTYIGSCLLGDGGKAAFTGLPISSISEAPKMKLVDSLRLGSSIRLDYEPL